MEDIGSTVVTTFGPAVVEDIPLTIGYHVPVPLTLSSCVLFFLLSLFLFVCVCVCVIYFFFPIVNDISVCYEF